jgi:hypothetical protein
MGQYDIHRQHQDRALDLAGCRRGDRQDRRSRRLCRRRSRISYGSVTATNATIIPVIKEGDVTGTMTSVADTI